MDNATDLAATLLPDYIMTELTHAVMVGAGYMSLTVCVDHGCLPALDIRGRDKCTAQEAAVA